MKNLLLPLLAAVLPLQAPASGEAAYLAELQARARQLELAQSAAWQRLLHYQPDRLGSGGTSTVGFAGFFNSPEGSVDPAAELDATLARFFGDQKVFDEPAQCRFKARYEWLRAELGFDPQRLPVQACERYETWATGINAASMTLVFASNDLNSPASMFGHTLLRVDPPGQARDERLLSYALNYAADNIDDNGLAYAWRGITGGYTGFFSIYPYYEKVKEYARFEHRDLWEYPLRLSAEETRRLLWHMWEMRGVGSPYYFFSQNCSFQLLSLIETVRPDLDLTSRFLYRGLPYAIPVDTLRQLRDAGLVGEPEYRPANAKRFRHDFMQLGPAQQQWVLGYAAGQASLEDAVLAQATARDRARMLEAAHDRLYFLFLEGELERSAGLPRDRAALLARSRITEPAGFVPMARPQTWPDQGHASGRLSLGLRADADDAALTLRLRPAYHDRLDPPAGYLPGGEIEFFDLAAQIGESGARFDGLRVVSVQAVAPRDLLFRPWSWLASTGARRLDLDALSDALSAAPHGAVGAYADGGAGLAWAPTPGSQLYAFGFASLDWNRDAERGYLARAGLRLGFAAQWSARFTQQLELEHLEGLSPQSHAWSEARLGSQWQIVPAQGLRLNLRHADNGLGHARHAEVLWQIYF